jgi:hypothetical protein
LLNKLQHDNELHIDLVSVAITVICQQETHHLGQGFLENCKLSFTTLRAEELENSEKDDHVVKIIFEKCVGLYICTPISELSGPVVS